jgi:hypothetical protein
MDSLSEDDKKLLTEFLGECWHKFQSDGMGSGYSCQKCKIHRTWTDKQDRPFTTWPDLGDLKEKLVKDNTWEEFDDFSYKEFMFRKGKRPYRYNSWLLSPAVFIPLVVEFLRKEKP